MGRNGGGESNAMERVAAYPRQFPYLLPVPNQDGVISAGKLRFLGDIVR
jgi:hypothetical protein